MDILSAFAILTVAGLIHASFQLSVSMLTLLSSHTIGRKQSQRRLILLTHSFVLGVAVMTILLLCALGLVFQATTSYVSFDMLWTILCGGMAGLAVAVLLFYYRKEQGTRLWIPHSMARFLTRRAKVTKHSAEAFSLGLVSVLGEALFIFIPLAVAIMVLVQYSPLLQLAGIAYYTFISLSSLLIVHVLISGGHSISRLQRWREQNKNFLQFGAGAALLALSFYIYVDQVMTMAVMAAERSIW